MLRGVSGASVPATGTRVFDILESESPGVLENASGDMIPLHTVRAREQGLADSRERLPSKEGVRSGLGELFARHRSQSSALPPRQETFTGSHYPRSHERGPIEAGVPMGGSVFDVRLSALSRARPH